MTAATPRTADSSRTADALCTADTPRTAAVIVAYNRADLLRQTLDALAAQTVQPDLVIVVNNAATDDTERIAREALDKLGERGRLITLTTNTGGAGGFAVGIAAALAAGRQADRDFDWVWVMDDDTVPRPTALAAALTAHRRYVASGQDDLAVMGSRVVWTDGSDHLMNTPKPKIGANRREWDRAIEAAVMPIRSISFVSAFLRVPRVRQTGLPIADYFLWNDDFEYSARLLRGARGIFVPQSVVAHHTKHNGSSDQDPGERFYVEVRNKLWVFRHSHALKPWERLAYRGATARRWIRTLLRSHNRNTLLTAARRGVRDAYAAPPRPTAEVLAGAGVPQDVLQEIDALSREETRR